MEAYYLLLLHIDQKSKAGVPITDFSQLEFEKLKINRATFILLIKNLFEAGYIRNIDFYFHDNEEIPAITSHLSVTFLGHQYLFDNKKLTKTKKFVNLAKTFVGIIPAIELFIN